MGQSPKKLLALPVLSWDIQNEIGTSKTCLPQFEDRILHALAYKRPSDPQVGLATRQQDSRQFLVLWQCFLLVRTCWWMMKRLDNSFNIFIYSFNWIPRRSLTPSIINKLLLSCYLRLPAHTWSVSFDMWSCKHSRQTHRSVHLVERCCSQLDMTHGWLSRPSMIPCAPTKLLLCRLDKLERRACIGSNKFVRQCRKPNLSLMDTLDENQDD